MRVIHYKNMPAQLNLTRLVVIYLLLDHVQASNVARAVTWTLFGLHTLVVLIAALTQEKVEILK